MHIAQIRKCGWTIILVFSLFEGNTIRAEKQDSIKYKDPPIYSAFFEGGKVQSSNHFLKQLNATNEELGEFTALSFRIYKQTTGKNLWEQYYNYPRFGAGIYVARFFNNNYLSTPIALYGTYMGSIRQWNKLSLHYDVGLGLTFNWESFNPSENNYNISLGAELSSYINAGLILNYEISPHFDLGLGYGFTHFSNGAIKIPNFGLNTLAPKISLEYRIDKFKQPKIRSFIPPYIQNTSINVSVFGGEKNVIYPECNLDTASIFNGVHYSVLGVNTIIYRQIDYKSKIGIGMTVGYDGSKNAVISLVRGMPDPDQRFRGQNITLSIYPSYELIFNKISLFAQPSFYVLKRQTTYKRPAYFTRVGFKYSISKNLFTGLGLHSYNFHKADFIEWTIGYQILLSKKSNK